MQKAIKGIIQTLKPWELEQVHWTAEGDVVEASEGAVGKEVATIVKPGAADKWVHSYWDGQWKPWKGDPFMQEGKVDLVLLRKANEKSQYPRQMSSSSVKTTLYRGEDQRRWDGSVEQAAWRGEAGMGPLYVKILRAVRRSGSAGEELWSQLDMVDQIMHHASRRSGPIWEGLVQQIRKAQKGVGLSLGPESVWAWTPDTPMLGPQLSWLNIMRPGEPRTDVTLRMVWGKVEDRQIASMRSRMEERGLDLWDWYIVPAGALDQTFGGRTQWVDGVGARKICTLPAATLGKEMTEGELWFVGGEQAFGTIDWEPVDVGETLGRKAVQEWLGLSPEDVGVWQTSNEGYAWARGSTIVRLEERCTAAALVDSGVKAAELARVGMEMVWGLKRVYKREVWNKCGGREEEEGVSPETPSVMVVRGKDQTRGPYQMPSNTQVRKKGLTVGRKLKEGQRWRALQVCNLDELVNEGSTEKKKPSKKSKWIPKKAGQWLRLIELAASRKRKGPPTPVEESEECQLCGREAAATQEGVRLCRRCNNSAPGAALGRELEGYMLASWCLAQLGGEAWMRTVMLDKGRWRRWRIALRNEERSEGARRWWWRLLAAITSEEEREAMQTVSGNVLTAEEWNARWETELQGTQGLSLLYEFYEEQPSGCRTAWHRRQLRVIYNMWGVQTPLEASLIGRGEEALEGWAARGRVGSSRWPKHRGEVVSEERWAEMLKELRDRQNEAMARVKEMRQQMKRQRVERAAMEAETKRRDQAERAAERQRASENRKRQPVLHRVSGEGHGGEFDKQWGRGVGFWVRTARPPGRGLKWLEGKAVRTSVHEAKRWPEGRPGIRKAVVGQYLRWVADEALGCQEGGGEGQQDPDRSAGATATINAADDLRVEGLNDRRDLSECGNPARQTEGEARSEREELEDAGPTTRAAARAREVEGRTLRGQTGNVGKVVGKRRTGSRPKGPRQPQGAVSVPSHTPQPHQAQPRGERRSTGSRTGAPAKPREGIG